METAYIENVPEGPDAEEFTTYVYHDKVMLLVPLTLAPDLPKGPLRLSAKVSWLECSIQCIPGNGTIEGTLTVGDEEVPSFESVLITEAERQLPKDGSSLSVQAAWSGPADGDLRPMVVEWPASATLTG